MKTLLIIICALCSSIYTNINDGGTQIALEKGIMKKLFLFLLFSLFTVSLSAQTNNSPKYFKYQGEAIIGAGINIDNNKNYYAAVPIEIVNGIRFGEYFFAGVGTGLSVMIDGGIEYWSIALPLYVNAKGYFPVADKISLFLSCDAGGKIGLADLSGTNGIMVRPAVGVSFASSDKRFAHNITLGYDYDRFMVKINGINAHSDENAISIRYGFQF